MRNRNFDTRPTQAGGRTADYYGHTALEPEQSGWVDWPWLIAGLIVSAVVWYLAR